MVYFIKPWTISLRLYQAYLACYISLKEIYLGLKPQSLRGYVRINYGSLYRKLCTIYGRINVSNLSLLSLPIYNLYRFLPLIVVF